MKIKKIYLYSAIIFSIIVGGALGYFGRSFIGTGTTAGTSVKSGEVRVNSPEYKFINPIVFLDNDQRIYNEYNSLDKSLNSYIQSEENNKDVSSVSVYYRDLNTGHWAGINEDQTYEPSSMLKVLVLLSYLKHATNDPSILTQQLVYHKSTDDAQTYYKPVNSLVDGHSYMAEDLLQNMIISSDNGAMNTLVPNITHDLSDAYKALELPTPPLNVNIVNANFMSAKSYSRVFRTLYNGTYLPWNLSEQALELLSQTDFKNGINAGVPADMVVSHKFGEHTNLLASGTVDSRELHDCGIVYYPTNPYLICIMTKGQEFPKLEGVISNISKIIYNYVNNANK